MFFSKRKRKEGDGADAQQGTFLKGIATISNPLKWPGMLSNRSAKSGQQGGLGELSAADTALRELEIFMEQLCSEPKFSNMNTSSASLLELSRMNTTSFATADDAGHGPLALPSPAVDEATVHEIVATFCRRRLVSRAITEELLTRATTLLEALPNVVEFTVPEGCYLTVVGDLHGQYQDLMHLFRTYGFPSPTRPYLFNGDFVDRGDCGVEITLTLLAFQQLHPGSVLLNRGNHEERSVHMLMGFFQECTNKYDKEVYEMFNVAFGHLPIATVINGAVCVVHGGVDAKVSLADVRTIPRSEYQTYAGQMGNPGGKPGLVHPAMRDKIAAIRKRAELMHPINACLWNDPINVPGEGFNKTRGTGMLFGPDVCKDFLEREGLQLLIRSHEMTPDGYDWPFGDNLLHGCITVFSASNYACTATNRGGVVRIGAPGSRAPKGVTLGESDPTHRIGKKGSRASSSSSDDADTPEDLDEPTLAPPPMFGGGGGGGGFGLQKSRSNVMALIQAGNPDADGADKSDDEEDADADATHGSSTNVLQLKGSAPRGPPRGLSGGGLPGGSHAG